MRLFEGPAHQVVLKTTSLFFAIGIAGVLILTGHQNAQKAGGNSQPGVAPDSVLPNQIYTPLVSPMSPDEHMRFLLSTSKSMVLPRQELDSLMDRLRAATEDGQTLKLEPHSVFANTVVQSTQVSNSTQTLTLPVPSNNLEPEPSQQKQRP